MGEYRVRGTPVGDFSYARGNTDWGSESETLPSDYVAQVRHAINYGREWRRDVVGEREEIERRTNGVANLSSDEDENGDEDAVYDRRRIPTDP